MRKFIAVFMIIYLSITTSIAQFSSLKSQSMASSKIPVLEHKNPDQGFTSETHKSYVSQIVFTDKPNAIAFKNENPTQFKNEFNGSDPIYARVYLSHSIGNTPHDGQKTYKAHIMYDLYIDGKKMPFQKAFGMYRHVPQDERTYYFEDIDNNDQLDKWTSWRPTILPDDSNDDLKYGNVNTMARCLALTLMDIPAGKHEVELRMYSRDFASGAQTEVLASGSFTLHLSEKDKKSLAFKYAPPLPKDKWTGSNKTQITAELQKAFEKEIGKKPILTGIYSADWSEGTYSLTGQRYRKIAGWAVFGDTDGDGQVPITTFNFISDYSGGDWTTLRFNSHCLGCADWDVEVAAVQALLRNN